MGRRLGLFVAFLGVAATAAAAPPAKKAAGQSASTAAKAKTAGSGSAAPAGSGSGSGSDESAGSGSADEDKLPPHITGPKTVDLGNSITVDLPAGMILFEAAVAKQIEEQGGNSADNVLAIIAKPTSTWWMSVEYENVGYVNDSDADKLDADELFDNYKQGVAQQNEKKKQMGQPELVLDSWSERPRYDRPVHHLLWGLKGHDVNRAFINYFTRVLGRNGYMSIDLIDSVDNIEKSKVDAQPVVAAIQFNTGARYEDHASSDKDSGIGLKALILGGAGIAVVKAAKAGIIIKLLLVFKKGFILVFAAIAAFFRKLTGRKKKPKDVEPSVPPPPDGGSAGGPPPGPPNV